MVERTPSLSDAVKQSVKTFLEASGDEYLTDLHARFMNEVDSAILRVTMEHCQGNQTEATKTLGMSRATLRKKLTQHSLLYHGKDADVYLTHKLPD